MGLQTKLFTPALLPVESRIDLLENMLKTHDWGYEKTDDGSRHSKGLRSIKEIEELINCLRLEGLCVEVEEVWDRHCPWCK